MKYRNIALNNQWIIHKIEESSICLFCSKRVSQSYLNDTYSHKEIINLDCDCGSYFSLYNDHLSFLCIIAVNTKHHLCYSFNNNELHAYNSIETRELFELDPNQLNLERLDKLNQLFDKIERLEFYL